MHGIVYDIKRGEKMKKYLLIIVVVLLMATGCQLATLSIIEVENAPDISAKSIDPTAKLQLINDGTKHKYIIYQANSEIDASVEAENNVVKINLDKRNETEGDPQQHIYYLTTEDKHDTIQVFADGIEIPFNNVTSK